MTRQARGTTDRTTLAPLARDVDERADGERGEAEETECEREDGEPGHPAQEPRAAVPHRAAHAVVVALDHGRIHRRDAVVAEDLVDLLESKTAIAQRANEWAERGNGVRSIAAAVVHQHYTAVEFLESTHEIADDDLLLGPRPVVRVDVRSDGDHAVAR